jgi:anti-sigma factor (TIGR02949 family)
MNDDCDWVHEHLDAYDDGELDAEHAGRIARHLDGCDACMTVYRQLRQLRKLLQSTLRYHRTPSDLRARVLQLDTDTRDAPAMGRERAHKPRWAAPLQRWALPMAAALALAVGLDQLRDTQRQQQALVDELVGAHMRSLMAAQPDDVISTDRHTVKPWFSGKLEYAPPVYDLGNQGFPLAGGRLDFVRGRSVAALDYRAQHHMINVYVWPSSYGFSVPERMLNDSGFHLMHWTSGGMDWWAVSDVGASTLSEFATLLQQQGS